MTAHGVVLLSGGIDSAVCLAIAKERLDNVYPVFFRYGQKSQEEELRAVKEQVSDHNETIQLIDMESAFMNYNQGAISTEAYDSHTNRTGQLHSPGYVPQRNIQLLSSASAWAESNLDRGENINLYFGAQYGDTDEYPDCRPGFVNDAMKVLNRGTDKHEITIETPLIDYDKETVIEKGEEYGINWLHTASCYVPPGPKQGCAECPACVERRRAFEEAGVMDPIDYEILP